MHTASIGIDLGKTTFHLVALGELRKVLVRKRFSRTQLLAYTANLPSSLIGLEACAGAHLLGPHCDNKGTKCDSFLASSSSATVSPTRTTSSTIGLGYSQHQGVIRDISASGMFLYSDFTAPIGAEIELKVLPPIRGARPAIYRAVVVRVTAGVSGAAVGVGLTLMGTRPGTALQSLGAALVLRESARGSREPVAARN